MHEKPQVEFSERKITTLVKDCRMNLKLAKSFLFALRILEILPHEFRRIKNAIIFIQVSNFTKKCEVSISINIQIFVNKLLSHISIIIIIGIYKTPLGEAKKAFWCSHRTVVALPMISVKLSK